MQTIETLSIEKDEVLRRALTLAVVSVEQRVEALRAEWRAMSPRQQSEMPGLEEQVYSEQVALRRLEALRNAAYHG